jgi:hypothetical protein
MSELCCEEKCEEICSFCNEKICQKWLPLIKCDGHINCDTEICSECWRDFSISLTCSMCQETYSCCNLDENFDDMSTLLPSALSLICESCIVQNQTFVNVLKNIKSANNIKKVLRFYLSENVINKIFQYLYGKEILEYF